MLRCSTRRLQMGSQLGVGYQHMGRPDHHQPTADDVRDTTPNIPRMRVSWYDYGELHPAKKLSYFIVRHLRKLPAEWQPYYHSLFRSELAATRNVNKNWDQFCYVLEGYRKAKWVLKKYGEEPEPNSIPEPYNDLWNKSTQEERAWAYRRSFHLKELQALQRETCYSFGSVSRDRSTTIASHVESTQMDPMKMQTGNNVHSDDLPTPKESEIRDDGEMSEIYMMTIQDDKKWNPLLKKDNSTDAEFWEFEDEDGDDDDVDSTISKSSLNRQFALASKTQRSSSSSTSSGAHVDASPSGGDDLDEEIDEADFQRFMGKKKQQQQQQAETSASAEFVGDGGGLRSSKRIPSKMNSTQREI